MRMHSILIFRAVFCVTIWPVICYHYGVNKDRRAHFAHTHAYTSKYYDTQKGLAAFGSAY